MSVCVRERVCECVCVRKRVCVRERSVCESVRVCECVYVRERECVHTDNYHFKLCLSFLECKDFSALSCIHCIQ